MTFCVQTSKVSVLRARQDAMREVTVKIRFNHECLGAVRKGKCSTMLRDPDGRVMFMPTWWKSILTFAARLLCRHQELVKDIEWDPLVDGDTVEFKRFYEAGKWALHEAFVRGSVIAVHCVLPSGISDKEFLEMMKVAGTYKGISPYKPDRKYGTFSVLSVLPKTRALPEPEISAQAVS